MGVSVRTISVLAGTAVVVVSTFTKPTFSTFPTIKQVAAWPDTVKLKWRWQGGETTTYTVGTGTTHLKRLTAPNTNVAICTLSTATPPGTMIQGTVEGIGNVTASAEFTIGVGALTVS